jgi:hypothetical protein
MSHLRGGAPIARAPRGYDPRNLPVCDGPDKTKSILNTLRFTALLRREVAECTCCISMAFACEQTLPVSRYRIHRR